MKNEHYKTSLEAIISQSPRVLILGSMPGEISLTKGMYYGNPQNHFWKIMFNLFECSYSENYEQRKQLILSNHLALWDVLESCERKGSLDSNIRNATLNDIGGLLQQYPSIQVIALNGSEADRRLNKSYRQRLKSELTYLKLPSTSPVPGKNVLRYEDKLEAWRRILEWL